MRKRNYQVWGEIQNWRTLGSMPKDLWACDQCDNACRMYFNFLKPNLAIEDACVGIFKQRFNTSRWPAHDEIDIIGMNREEGGNRKQGKKKREKSSTFPGSSKFYISCSTLKISSAKKLIDPELTIVFCKKQRANPTPKHTPDPQSKIIIRCMSCGRCMLDFVFPAPDA